MPKAERLSREALIAITNSYFDGLTGRATGPSSSRIPDAPAWRTATL